VRFVVNGGFASSTATTTVVVVVTDGLLDRPAEERPRSDSYLVIELLFQVHLGRSGSDRCHGGYQSKSRKHHRLLLKENRQQQASNNDLVPGRRSSRFLAFVGWRRHVFLVFSSLPFGPKLAQDFRNCFRHTQTLPKSNGIDMTSYALHVEKMF